MGDSDCKGMSISQVMALLKDVGEEGVNLRVVSLMDSNASMVMPLPLTQHEVMVTSTVSVGGSCDDIMLMWSNGAYSFVCVCVYTIIDLLPHLIDIFIYTVYHYRSALSCLLPHLHNRTESLYCCSLNTMGLGALHLISPLKDRK